jgi:hypothetical protein
MSRGYSVSKIGLYVYQVYQFEPHGAHKRISFSKEGSGSKFFEFIPKFISSHTGANKNNEISRSWRFEPSPAKGFSHDGLIKYGTFGYSSDIINLDDGEVLLIRKPDHVEEIPLYYQFWIPNHGEYGFAVFQSYGDRSCVDQIKSAVIHSFNTQNDDVNISMNRVMPTDSTMYENSAVKKLMLVTKKAPKDRAEVLRPLLAETIDVEVSFSPQRRGSFGQLKDVIKSIKKSDGHSALVFGDMEFDEASALVKVGNSYLKVRIIGPARQAGVIDVTDRVKLGADMHPELPSISKVAISLIGDFKEAYGMR